MCFAQLVARSSAKMSNGTVIPLSLSSARSSLDYYNSLGGSALPTELLQQTSISATLTGSQQPVATAVAPSVMPPAETPFAADGGAMASARDIHRLEIAMRDTMELNERVMAQNIALMTDLEIAQRTVRELRAGKDALASQLQRAMMEIEAAAPKQHASD